MSACVHPELVSWHDTFPGNWNYQCKACGKGAIIPITRLLIEEDSKHVSHQEASHAVRQRAIDIVGQAFGTPWQEKMQREAHQWEAVEEISK